MTMSFTGSAVGALGPQSAVPVWVGLGTAGLPEEVSYWGWILRCQSYMPHALAASCLPLKM